MKKTRAQINRENAAKSTGPKTEAGKQKCSLNAMRHALTGQVIVLPTDDLTAYLKHTQAFHGEYHPQGPTESHLVQTLADCSWRLNRVRAIEHNLLAIGFDRQVEQSGHPQIHAALATAKGTRHHLRQIAIFSQHEARLERQFRQTLALIRELQFERQAQPKAATSAPAPEPAKTQNGSVFPTSQPNHYACTPTTRANAQSETINLT